MERLEQERNHLKHDNDKLEAKVSSRGETIQGQIFIFNRSVLFFRDG